MMRQKLADLAKYRPAFSEQYFKEDGEDLARQSFDPGAVRYKFYEKRSHKMRVDSLRSTDCEWAVHRNEYERL